MNSRVGVIVPSNILMAPYLKYYEEVLSECESDYRIISWDRFGMKEDADYTFHFRVENHKRFKVLIGHVLFAAFCKRIIKKEKFNKIIVLTQAPAFFMGLRFIKRYQGNFLWDIRDDSPFRKRAPKYLKEISNNAFQVVVSSPMYSEWFDVNTIICHNVDKNMLYQYSDCLRNDIKKDKLKIVYAGSMIEPTMNINIIKHLSNDERYELWYIGRNNIAKKSIEHFVEDNSIKNVFFRGTYQKEDIVNIYRSEADLVNIFREKSIVNAYALPNKLYDAVLSGIPVVVFDHNKAISTLVANYSLGIILEESDIDNIGDVLLKKYREFDKNEYYEKRSLFLEQIKKDMDLFEKRVTQFISM